MASSMDLSQAVAAGVASGLSGGRKRARSASIKSSSAKKGKRSISRNIAWKGQVVPPVLKTKLKYCDNVTASSAGGDYTYVLRLNSIYDFDYTGVGHQPMGHDELAQLYDSYRVTGVRWLIKAVCIDANNATPMRCSAWVNNVTTNAASQSEAEEQSGARNTLALWGGRSQASLTGYTNIAHELGLTPAQAESDDNSLALFNATPASIIYLHLRFQTGIATFGVNFQIYATIDVECKDPKRLVQS